MTQAQFLLPGDIIKHYGRLLTINSMPARKATANYLVQVTADATGHLATLTFFDDEPVEVVDVNADYRATVVS